MTAGSARLARIRELRDRGASLEEIGRQLGISRQRVLQVLGPTGRRARRYRMSRVSVSRGLTAAR